MKANTLFPIVPLGEDVQKGSTQGQIGRLEVLPIAKLYVDSVYQRAVSVASVRNIKRICIGFDWAKFLPVIVAKDGDRFAIVDGQHRTTAAATLGIKAVPCYILSCSPAEAAAAFAAINGNVTPVQPIDLWFAQLAAGDASCIALKAVLDAAGVTVVRKRDGYQVGETRSINVLRRAFEFYGPAILTTILQCIVETGNGNPGMIYGAILHGIGLAIRTKPELLAGPSQLFEIFDGLDLSELAHEAGIEAARTGNNQQAILVRVFNEKIRAAKPSMGERTAVPTKGARRAA